MKKGKVIKIDKTVKLPKQYLHTGVIEDKIKGHPIYLIRIFHKNSQNKVLFQFIEGDKLCQ